MKVGQKVRVRKDIVDTQRFPGNTIQDIIHDSMREMAGEVLTIKSIIDEKKKYDFTVLENQWNWKKEWVEFINEIEVIEL